MPWLIYDGDCRFCAARASSIAEKWKGRAVALASSSLEPDVLVANGISADDLARGAVWIDDDGVVSRGHRAIARALVAAGAWRAVVGSLIDTPPGALVAAPIYRSVVRFRHRL